MAEAQAQALAGSLVASEPVRQLMARRSRPKSSRTKAKGGCLLLRREQRQGGKLMAKSQFEFQHNEEGCLEVFKDGRKVGMIYTIGDDLLDVDTMTILPSCGTPEAKVEQPTQLHIRQK